MIALYIASSPGRQFKFRKKDGLVAIATMLVLMRWPLREKQVIVYLACKPFALFHLYNGRYSDIFFKSLFKAHNIHQWKEQQIYIPTISYVYND